ncbi:Fe-S cluster assembly protein SufB [Candidatus Peregrinibacteria bacterium]|nr:Fe-S cluster assembly protein SufB [Candidatus Peregrinibacteria bacterium]
MPKTIQTHANHKLLYKSPKGLNEDLIKKISEEKQEPEWMTEYRLKAFKLFTRIPMPTFGPSLSNLNLDNIHYYIKPQDRIKTRWEDVPQDIKDTFERLGVPEAERKFLAGTGAQFESEMVYHSIKKELAEKGVIFESIEQGLKNHPDLFKEYFGKIVPASDNKFAALNSAVWSGGSFIYIPKNVKLDLPLQAYFRMNTENLGQFERTLIIADEGADLHYMEGCTAPVYSTESLHAAVVEIVAKNNARIQYSTIQNWSENIYNLVTKRAFAYSNSEVVWLDCNIGSYMTMKYPAIYLLRDGAKGEVHSLAISSKDQQQDTGARIIHGADNTRSNIISKTIALDEGISTYRGIIKANKNIKNAKSKVKCDTLLLSPDAISNTYPQIKSNSRDFTIEHEASVSKINEEQLFYMKSRGLDEDEAASQIVNGFADPIVKRLPMEYALELNRLMEMEMEGSIA